MAGSPRRRMFAGSAGRNHLGRPVNQERPAERSRRRGHSLQELNGPALWPAFPRGVSPARRRRRDRRTLSFPSLLQNAFTSYPLVRRPPGHPRHELTSEGRGDASSLTDTRLKGGVLARKRGQVSSFTAERKCSRLVVHVLSTAKQKSLHGDGS